MWRFLLADVQFAILGVDFLRSHKLLVDPAANCLVDTASLQSFDTAAEVSSPAAAACAACGIHLAAGSAGVAGVSTSTPSTSGNELSPAGRRPGARPTPGRRGSVASWR